MKGKSRAKRFVEDDSSQTTPKRKKTSIDIRQTRLKEVEEDLRDLKDRIGFKE